MKKNLFLFLFIFLSFSLIAQQDNGGTIKVQKKGQVYSIFFDNVNNRLIGKDYYGNILDSAVVSFDVMVTIQGIASQETVIGTTLSSTMQNKIKRVDKGTTLFFSNIKVKEKNGTLIDWPKFTSKIGLAYEKDE
ncbi:MAG: hypothetical protein NTX97_10625 [Bacteroidetes bacterium]|nr:hypothetical protein [Bacteroidota bacterium]